MAIRDIKLNYGYPALFLSKNSLNAEQSPSLINHLFGMIEHFKFMLNIQYKGLCYDSRYIRLLIERNIISIKKPYDMNNYDFNLTMDWFYTIVIKITSMHLPWFSKELIQIRYPIHLQSSITCRPINTHALLITLDNDNRSSVCYMKIPRYQTDDSVFINGQPLNSMLDGIFNTKAWDDIHFQNRIDGLYLI